eukprot:TRINITY_DN12584_c0_g1_i2.p4 TRINITY_DN12584_c0_g1~~TRINITY_DN12584_c0_g1_i2.p4  ORF type:complete len:100 (-),score=30.56 TRINITY_DN12584_c0_g1_i2:24-323(-)
MSREKAHVGVMVGNFKLLKKIGEGGFGEVWEVMDVQAGSKAALKVPSKAGAEDLLVELRGYEQVGTESRNFLRDVRLVNGCQVPQRRPVLLQHFIPMPE